jgi:hypothetical protein
MLQNDDKILQEKNSEGILIALYKRLQNYFYKRITCADGTNPHAGSLSPPALSEVFHELSTAASDI